MTRSEAKAVLAVAAQIQELAESATRLSRIDPRLIEPDFVTETIDAIAHDLMQLAQAVKKIIVQFD